MSKSGQGKACPNSECPFHSKKNQDNIALHGFSKKKQGRTRRYRCMACSKTFCSSQGTPYYRLQHSRNAFDLVASMTVEGVSKSSIARIMGISWNTVARWEKKATTAAKAFNARMTKGYDLFEIQADEIRTFTGGKKQTTWVFASMIVSSRLWTATVIGRRSYKNTRRLLSETIWPGRFKAPVFITTDGFDYYARVARELFPNACVHGQVIKQWGRNRVQRIDRTLASGKPSQLDEALAMSEDSDEINTSFIERLNLTIRRGSAYLQRKTPCHSRDPERLNDQLELLRCHYNFLRPHRSLKFGKVTRTPAMQAGLVNRRLTFRQVFMAGGGFVCRVPYRLLEVVDFEEPIRLESGLRKAA
jgi:transposase-like protein/IS1 family transposase